MNKRRRFKAKRRRAVATLLYRHTHEHRQMRDACDRAVRAALALAEPSRQVGFLLQWIVDRGRDGTLDIVPPLDAMLGLTPPEASR